MIRWALVNYIKIGAPNSRLLILIPRLDLVRRRRLIGANALRLLLNQIGHLWRRGRSIEILQLGVIGKLSRRHKLELPRAGEKLIDTKRAAIDIHQISPPGIAR